MRTLRGRLTLLAVMFTIILIGTLVYSALKPTITVDLSQTGVPIDTVVTFDSQIIKPSGAGGAKYTSKVSPGKTKIEVNSPSHSYYSEEVDIGLGSKRTIEPKLEPKKVSDIVGLFFDPEIYINANEKMFGTDWLVFTSGSRAGGDDGVIVVAKLNSVTGGWETIEVGTAIARDDLVGAPAGLAEYVESL